MQLTANIKSVLIVAACSLSLVGPPASADDRDSASPWGVASGAEWAKEYPRFNPILREGGVRWLRIFDEWGWIQPKPGEWKWEQMDAKLADAKKNGIRLTGGLWYFAPWATRDGDERTAPLKDINAWSEYVSAAVTRYKSDIRHWEVLNEFNGSFGKTTSGNKPKDYADLVRAAHVAAKKADPDAMIGLNCANFDLGFFDSVIKAGAADHFEFVCIHPYENIAMAMAGEEGAYLTMAGSIRKMLAENKQRTDIPIWITEAGVLAPVEADPKADAAQAQGLVKLYVLSIAQGISRVFWFEARGPTYGDGIDHGLIRKDWSERPAMTALTTMTGLLGAEPKFAGWLDNGGAYGFAFLNQAESVLVLWSPPGEPKAITFSSDVTTVDLSGKRAALKAGAPIRLTVAPTFIVQPPADLVQQAKANLAKPFPWGGHYADAPLVTCRLAATNIDKGITQIHTKTTAVEHDLAESHRRSDITNRALNGEGSYAYFRVDSAFAGFGTKELEITVVAKRMDAKKAAGFAMTYESLSGYKGANGYWEIPGGGGWHEKTWKVADANFVSGWGWNFRTDASGSRGDFVIKEVRVSKVGKLK